MRKQPAESPVRFTGLKPDPHIGEDAPHPQGDNRKVMHDTDHQPTPVYSSDHQPLMPTHPAKPTSCQPMTAPCSTTSRDCSAFDC